MEDLSLVLECRFQDCHRLAAFRVALQPIPLFGLDDTSIETSSPKPPHINLAMKQSFCSNKIFHLWCESRYSYGIL